MEAGRIEKNQEEIIKKLAAIESLLRQLPEVQAGVLIQMYEESQALRIQGRKLSDVLTIAPPDAR